MPAFFKIEKECRLVITAAGVLTFAIPVPLRNSPSSHHWTCPILPLECSRA